MMNYFERNRRWLIPAMGGFMIAAGAVMLKVVAGTSPDPSVATLPSWMPVAGLAIAGFGAGIGAMLTDTASAHIMRFVGTAGACAVLLHAIFK